MTIDLRRFFTRQPVARPSYAHHIRQVTDLRSGEVQNQAVQVTSRCGKGRIRTTRTLTLKVG